MPFPTTAEKNQLVTAARGLPVDAPARPVSQFVSQALNLPPLQVGNHLNNGTTRARVLDVFAKSRRRIIERELNLPTFAEYELAGVDVISGLKTHLQNMPNVPNNVIQRIHSFPQVRDALVALAQGHHLEAVATAILRTRFPNVSATKRSADEGVDAIGSMPLFETPDVLGVGKATLTQRLAEKFFVVASSKAEMSHVPLNRQALQPAHVRDLAGTTWIHRFHYGMWNKQGIKSLSPVLPLMVTTYRVNASAKSRCNELGISVWRLSDLIYWICAEAPPAVFDPNNHYAFSQVAFDQWWGIYDANRIN